MTDGFARLAATLADRYRIERELGEGGMATVYLAEDLKHDRRVALKVLKPELAAMMGSERFLAEIRTTANLQHPHILPLFDSGEADGFLYFVTPYIDGETLRDRLDREKQLPVEEAVRIARAVASALQVAHEQGVVHRDIKPANILLSRGEPLVADFGIALAVSEAGGARLTETGLSMGTPYYMSPEQATGDRDVGAQSDVYALGCVTYEMLVGDPPHVGSTAQAVLGKILTETPKAPSAVRAVVPPNVEGAVLKALEKLPADRFPTAQSFADALADPTFRYGPAETSAVAALRRPRWLWAWAVAATVAAVALGAGLALRSRTSSAGPVMQFEVTLPPHLTAAFGNGVNFDVSPDGSKLVFAGLDSAGTQSLWLRASDRITPVRLPGTDGAHNVRFSPDGRSVAYVAGDSISTVSLTGAPPLTVVPDSVAAGLAWGSEGYLYYRRRSGGIWRVPATGGKSERLLAPASGGREGWFDALPDGKGVLFSTVVLGDLTQSQVAVLNLRTGEVKVLLRATMARFAPPGDLLYTTAQGQLLSVPFDVSHLRLAGPPRPVLDGVQINIGSASYFATSASGALLYGTGGTPSQPTPVWISADGSTAALPLPSQVGLVADPSVSPDGRRVAFDFLKFQGGGVDIWIYDVAQRTLSPLTLDGHAGGPFWSPDGTDVGYRSWVPGAEGIYERRADFSGQAHRLVPATKAVTSPASYRAAWMPDGRTLLYVDSAGHLLSLSPGGHAAPRPVLGPNATVGTFSLSPDGRRVAYDSDVSGSYQVYVAPVSGPGGRIQVSVSGGRFPVWTRDGDGIVYDVSASDAWMLAMVRTKPTLAVVSRRKFADAGAYNAGVGFDTAPDGRIVAIRYGAATNKLFAMRFVTDWRRAFGVGR